MIRRHKVGSIASFEFLSTIKRKGYLIATFGMPVFVLLYGGLVSGLGFFVKSKESEVRIYGVVDRAELLDLKGAVARSSLGDEIPANIRKAIQAAGKSGPMGDFGWFENNIFRPFPNAEEARHALSQGVVRGYFVLAEDFLSSGRLEEYFSEGPGLDTSDTRQSLRSLIVERILKDNVSEEIARRIRNPIGEVSSWTVTSQGEIKKRSPFAIVAKIVVPMIFTILFFISLMMSAGYLIQGTSAEKENKVVEVLLSSAGAEEIMAGKLLGLGAAGLLQVGVWFGMLIVSGLFFAATLATFGIEISWGAIAAALFFFVAGYLFLGSLMLGTGSLGSSFKESQQFAGVWTVLTVIPLIFLGIFLQDPHATIALVLTWIPFTAPVTVILRMTLDPSGIAWWEIAGSFLVLLASTYLAVRLGARLFRIGLLLTGTRPKLRQILRQARSG